MRKYNRIPKQHFELFLKECEWRFNGGTPRQLNIVVSEEVYFDFKAYALSARKPMKEVVADIIFDNIKNQK